MFKNHNICKNEDDDTSDHSDSENDSESTQNTNKHDDFARPPRIHINPEKEQHEFEEAVKNNKVSLYCSKCQGYVHVNKLVISKLVLHKKPRPGGITYFTSGVCIRNHTTWEAIRFIKPVLKKTKEEDLGFFERICKDFYD